MNTNVTTRHLVSLVARSLPRTGVLLVLWILAMAGCKSPPKVGDFCKNEEEGSSVCLDGTTALFCQGNRRVALPCRGPKGCAAAGEKGTCDASVGREGDPCDSKADSYAAAGVDRTCAEDKSRSLVCKDGKMVLDRLCRGPDGCDMAKAKSGRLTACDRTSAAVGESCDPHRIGDGTSSVGVCSVDKKAALICDKDDNGHFVVGRTCAGPKGCVMGHLSGSPDLPAAVCDQSVADLDTPCGTQDMNALTCSADGQLVLFCDPSSYKWLKHKDCGPKAKCVYQERKVVIDGLECRPVDKR